MRLSLVFLLTMVGFNTQANDSTNTWKRLTKGFNKTYIKFKSVEPTVQRKILKNIHVLDFRYDKDRLGMYADEFYHPTEIYLDKKETLQSLLADKLKDEKAGNAEVLIIMQDFWMTDIFPEVDNPLSPKRVTFNTSKLICKLDVFLKQENAYVPLTRIDTTFWTGKRIFSSADNLLETLISHLNEKVAIEIEEDKFKSRKKLSKEFLENHYSKKLSSAAISDISLNKGVYQTYGDFKNNKPSTTSFRMLASKNEPPLLYLVDEKGNEQLTRGVWGVNDGKNTYIMQGGRLFHLYKDGGAFFWVGLKEVKSKTVRVPAGTPLGGGWALVGLEGIATIVKFRLTPYLLNLETGEAY